MTLLPHINLTWNFQHTGRQTEKEMNHCTAPIWISCQCSDSLRPETELGNLLAVGCQAKVRNSDMHHCSAELLNYSKQKFLRATSTSDMTLSACASLGDFVPVLQYIWTANHSRTRKSVIFWLALTLHASVLLSATAFVFLKVPPLKSPSKIINLGQM